MKNLIKAALRVAVVMIPGGLVLLLGYGLGRALRTEWKAAALQSSGGPVPMRQVLAGLTVRNIVREAFI